VGAEGVSFIGKLFGSDKALEKGVDTATGLLDEAFYTDQEEAADKAAARDRAQGMVVEWIEASTGSRLARRAIALAITGTWLSMFIFATILSFAAIWVSTDVPDGGASTAQLMQASAALIDGRTERMTGAVMLILGFYFAAPYMGDLAEGALKRFGKQ
jgi:hypothetical protein